MKLFIFGLGYTGSFIAADQRSRGASVFATVRSQEHGRQLSIEGQTVRVFSDEEADSRIAEDIQESDALLLSVPPGESGDPVLKHWSSVIASAPRLRWIGYLSTVGVYGDHQGGWVNEATPVAPSSERSRQRAEAEQQWLAFGERHHKPVHLFRLAGIYGPGRNPLRRLAEGKVQNIVKPGQIFNRIHVADIARIVAASMERPRNGAIYNVADNEPAPPQDVIRFAATLCGIDSPPDIPFEQAQLSPMARSFYAENKRVRNGLLQNELKVTLGYPTYREGLRALQASGEGFFRQSP